MRSKPRIRLLIVLLIGMHLVILVAGFFAPYDAKAQNRNLPFAPPTRLHFTGTSGFHLRPFVYGVVSDSEGFRDDSAQQYPVRFFVRGSSYSLGLFKSDLHLFGVDSPARIMLFGSDAFGRDELSSLLFGGQISLAAGLVATLFTLAMAAVIGTVSGFYGGGVEEKLIGLFLFFFLFSLLLFF